MNVDVYGLIDLEVQAKLKYIGKKIEKKVNEEVGSNSVMDFTLREH